jgi:hypothetical protein
MNSAARYALWFIALLCVAAGAVGLAQQFAESQPIDYTIPCILLALGAGFVGASALFPDSAARSHCQSDEEANTEIKSESSVDAT